MTESERPEAQAKEILEALAEGIVIYDNEGEILAANRAAREIMQLEESDLVGRRYSSPAWTVTAVDGQPLALDERPDARAIENDEAALGERIVVEQPGADPVVLSVNAVPLGEDAPEGWSAIISFRDITDKKELEEKLEQERTQLEEVFLEAPAFLAVARGEDHVFERVNPRYRQLVGNRELLGRPVREVLPEIDDKFFDILDEVYQTGEPYHAEEQPMDIDTGNGIQRRYLNFVYQPLTETGEVNGILVHGVDVTKQRELAEQLQARTDQYEQILTEISDVVTVLQEDGTIRYSSPSVERVFGYNPEELVGRPVFDLVHPEEVEEVAEAFMAMVEDPEIAERTVQYRFRHAGGSWRQAESSGVAPEGETLGPVIVTRDITERIEAQQKYGAIFETTPSAIALVSLETGEFIEVNAAFLELLGYDREEVVGTTAKELGVWARPKQRDRIVDGLRETGSIHNVDAQFQDVDGNQIHVLFSGSVVEIAKDRYMLGVAQDITQRKAYQEALEHRTLHDQLTELPNRTLFHDRLLHAHKRAERKGEEIAVLFLDLDRFKTINDSLGHAAGDRVLRMVADRLTEALRADDTVARVGGDEFAVLLEAMSSKEDIDRAVTRIQQVFEVPFEVEETAFSLTASIGVAHSGLEIGDPDELVRLADAAMYQVKHPGSTDFHVFDPERDREVTEQLQREASLERAIEKEQFVLHYQPVVRLETGEIAGAEALVRWNHPERGLVRPGEFIPLAEETGLIVPLGQWVLEESLRQHRRWRESGVVDDERFRISVNLSARQHEIGGLNEKIRVAAREAGTSLSDLMVEITETVAMTGADTFQPLREEGLAVGIDDFGTGYSSLEYLRHFTADVLKLDRSFTANLAAPDQTAPLVEGILHVAEKLGLTLTAEGIETTEQLEILRGFGCPYGQGYLFSRALPPDAFTELYQD